jgi:hypothetical protein
MLFSILLILIKYINKLRSDIKVAVFWDVRPCNVKKDTVQALENSVNIKQITQYHRRDNLKYRMVKHSLLTFFFCYLSSTICVLIVNTRFSEIFLVCASKIIHNVNFRNVGSTAFVVS